MKLHRHLNQPRGRRAYYVSEVRIVSLAVHGRRTVELCMVEDVEGFRADIKGARFQEAHCLAKLHVEVVNAGAMKDAPRRVA